MKAKVKPSWIAPSFWLSSAVISSALRERSENGSRVKNTTPWLGVLVNCNGFSPGNATSLRMPSISMAIAAMRFITASVRSTAAAQRTRHRALVAACAAAEEAVEGTEDPAEQAVDQARWRVRRRVARPQQLGRQRRRQGQRVDRRDHGRDRDRDRELLVELAGH